MIRLILIRLLLVTLPIILWFVWAAIARRRGKPMGSTPWSWLIGAGLILAALSLFALGLSPGGISPEATYVPVEVGPGGEIVPGPR